MTEIPALHQMNPQSRFTSRAEDYAKYRPSYPSAVIDCIVAELGNVSKLVAADIGLYAYTHVAEDGGFDLTKFSAILAWFKRIKAQPKHILITDS